jgi:hypothetical protein
MKMTVPFHRFDQNRHQRPQPFTAHPVGCFPDHDQCFSDSIIV